MIRSAYFWAAAVLLAIIPLLVMDIPKHYVDWTREVHDEMITTMYNDYTLTGHQKEAILVNILDANKTLMAKMYIKGFAASILLCFSIYLFSQYSKVAVASAWRASGISVAMLAFVIALKLYSWTAYSGTDKIRLLSLSPADTSLQNIYNAHFKGKVLYVDFWGTTCGPCLAEFRNFTKPLKAQYHNRADIAYLYICGGHQLVWKQQLQKLDIEGSHIFLGEKDYAHYFRQAIKGDKDTLVAMPRYLIINKNGKISDTNAPRPSDKDSITSKLNKYLAAN